MDDEDRQGNDETKVKGNVDGRAGNSISVKKKIRIKNRKSSAKN